MLTEPGAGELDESRDRRRLRALAAGVTELVIGQPRGADLEPARKLCAAPAHAGAKSDQILWRHAKRYETPRAPCKRSSQMSSCQALQGSQSSDRVAARSAGCRGQRVEGPRVGNRFRFAEAHRRQKRGADLRGLPGLEDV